MALRGLGSQPRLFRANNPVHSLKRSAAMTDALSRGGSASRVDLFSYGLLGLPLAAGTLPVYLFVPTFYAEELGLGLAAVGAVLFWTRLLDVVSDPIIGWLSDRTPGRFGRRVPWIVIASSTSIRDPAMSSTGLTTSTRSPSSLQESQGER